MPQNIINIIRWPDVISNTDLWDKTGQSPIEVEIRKRKWGWIGHTLRKSPSNVTKQALDWNPQGKRKVGRPKQTWRRSTDAEVKAIGMTWAQLRRTSWNRVRWRSVVAALCSSVNQEAKTSKQALWTLGILLPQCGNIWSDLTQFWGPTVRILAKNSSEQSNSPHMPGVPPPPRA